MGDDKLCQGKENGKEGSEKAILIGVTELGDKRSSVIIDIPVKHVLGAKCSSLPCEYGKDDDHGDICIECSKFYCFMCKFFGHNLDKDKWICNSCFVNLIDG